MVTMFKSLYHNNELVGVAGVDMLITIIQQNINNIRFKETGIAHLIQSDGIVVASPQWVVGPETTEIIRYTDLTNPTIDEVTRDRILHDEQSIIVNGYLINSKRIYHNQYVIVFVVVFILSYLMSHQIIKSIMGLSTIAKTMASNLGRSNLAAGVDTTRLETSGVQEVSETTKQFVNIVKYLNNRKLQIGSTNPMYNHTTAQHMVWNGAYPEPLRAIPIQHVIPTAPPAPTVANVEQQRQPSTATYTPGQVVPKTVVV